MIDKDVTADNIYFGNFTENGSQGNAVIVINKGVTLTAKEGIYAAGGSNILTVESSREHLRRLMGICQIYSQRGA